MGADQASTPCTRPCTQAKRVYDSHHPPSTLPAFLYTHLHARYGHGHEPGAPPRARPRSAMRWVMSARGGWGCWCP